MRSKFLRTGIAVLLASGSAACIAAPASSGAQAAPCAPPEGPVDRLGYCSYPADVRAFVDDRDACDHWRGEPWPEDDEVNDNGEREWALHRRKEITDAINAACTGTDKRLALLKTAYAKDFHVMQLLDAYETDIEAGD